MDNEITLEEVKAKLNQNEAFTLLDVREPWEVATAAIAGAKPMPMGEVPSRAHQELDRKSRWSCFAITEYVP
jgi:rhodanese-related sulfurtransferase